MTPPGLARRWLACITPAHVRQSLLDDLDEVFRHLAATRGIAAARRWYWRQAIAGTPRLVAMGRPPGADWTRRLQRRRALNPAHFEFRGWDANGRFTPATRRGDPLVERKR